jgi:NTP pyrophosphatase (non-canonical NTP hydrolase)
MKDDYNFYNYCIQAKRTHSNLDTIEDTLIHMAMGVTTEIGEIVDIFKKNLAYAKDIDLVNLKEEIGDAFWYIANTYRTLNVYPTELNELARNNAALTFHKFNIKRFIAHTLYDVYDLYDNVIDYNESQNPQVIEAILCSLRLRLIVMCNHFGIDYIDCLKTNISKLEARYPEKFTQENALNRNLENERKILEQ